MRGLSLLESIVASFLLVLVVFSLLNLYPMISLSSHQGRQMLQADNLARSTLAELRCQKFSELVPGTVRDLEDVVLDGITYHRQVTFFRPESVASARVVGATLITRWSFRGTQRQLIRELLLHQVTFR